MKGKTLVLLLILAVFGAFMLPSVRLAVIARWRRATDNGERFTMDDMDADWGITP